MWRLVITLLATSVAVSMVYAGEVTFNIAGGWPYLSYGNLFLPGSISAVWWGTGESWTGYDRFYGEFTNITKLDKNYETLWKPSIPIKLAGESIGGGKAREIVKKLPYLALVIFSLFRILKKYCRKRR